MAATRALRITRSIRTLLIALLLGASTPIAAKDWVHEDLGAAGLLQALRKLETTATVLHVVAHPDDEDGALLTYLARGEGATTALFSITRGEGGANLISSDFFDALGILRSLEHAEAARHYGSEIFYSHAVDYGYSKTLEEASRQWRNGEPVLGDLVRVIRQLRPDVIISRFQGNRRDGHGHHQMAGVLSRRAMDAAADPERFPEQLEKEGLRPWRVSKLYIGVGWRPGPDVEKERAVIAVDVGRFDPILGRSYAQIARHGLGYQRSQGMSGFDSSPGPRIARYRLVESATGDAGTFDTSKREGSFFEGLETSVSAMARGEAAPQWLGDELRAIERAIAKAREAFDVTRIDASAPALAEGLRRARAALGKLKAEKDGHSEIAFRLGRKVEQLEDALAAALAIDLDVETAHRGDGLGHGVPGESYRCEAKLTQRAPGQELRWRGVRVESPDGIQAKFDVPDAPGDAGLRPNEPRVFEFELTLGDDAASTRPFWHRESIREPFYQIDETPHRGRPFPPPPVEGAARLEFEGVEFEVRSPLRVRLRHPEYGRVRYPFTVVPRVGVGFVNDSGIVPVGATTYEVDVRLQAGGAAAGKLRLELPEGWSATPQWLRFELVRAGQEETRRFTVRLPEGLAAGEFRIEAIAESDGKTYRESFRTISARDIGRFCLFKPARHTLRTAELRVAEDLSVGYIMGSGDEVPEALASLGVTPRMLSEGDLASGALDGFDAIVIGVRAYAVREDVRRFNRRLLDYVERGGVLIVQYQTPEFDNNYGPYPYSQGRRPEEVSEENARVTILEPEHVLLTTPNRITERDFDGWVEQRGSKFWSSWDERYEALLECHDTGQEPQRGGMLYARHGKGAYIYSAYAWYRQLPEGVPGAFRIYANMLSLRRTIAERQ